MIGTSSRFSTNLEAIVGMWMLALSKRMVIVNVTMPKMGGLEIIEE